MNLSAYIRVSTDKQADDGLGLEIQRDVIRSWAREHGHKIVEYHCDSGFSGSLDWSDRPGLGDALRDLRICRSGGLVVYKLDRIARELLVQEGLIREAAKFKKRIYSTFDDEDRLLEKDGTPDDGTRVFMRQVLGAVAEFEKDMIRVRMQAGIRMKREAGGYVGGAVPYGWQIVNGAVVEDELEQSQRGVIIAMRDAGATFRRIASTLDECGVPAPRGGSKWHATTVKRIADYDPAKLPA